MKKESRHRRPYKTILACFQLCITHKVSYEKIRFDITKPRTLRWSSVLAKRFDTETV